ncbi:MAG TPA: glycosyltransferase [Steroidobacteraceae bacterium]|nr:glycosyltransferase [Steroidobacteraceae bacterium]
MPKDIVLLSTADWDNPFWTNKQHVAVELIRRGHRVLYIDSLGLRHPSVSKRDLKRILGRARKALRVPREVRSGLWVWSPLVLPFQGNPLSCRTNRWLLEHGLDAHLRALGMKREWLWTYNPLTCQFLNLSSFERCIYHCVDEISGQPGMPVSALTSSEEELCRAANIVFTTSRVLTESRSRWNVRTHYLPNVADYRHFSSAMSSETEIPEDLARIAKPRLGFIGAISGYKVDFGLIRAVAEARPDWSIVLIGGVGEGDPWTDVSQLRGLPNVHLLGPRPYSALPAYLKGFSVTLLPNRINSYTDAMFPMKLFEYLASGCPVVSVSLKSIEDYGNVVSIAQSTQDFIESVASILAGNAPPLSLRLAVARQHTYITRMDQMLELLEPPNPPDETVRDTEPAS